jgi:Flp pilus assembly pilin Flp
VQAKSSGTVLWGTFKKEKKMKLLTRFWKDERGLETAEWALLLGIVVLTATVAAMGARGAIQTILEEMRDELTAAQP